MTIQNDNLCSIECTSSQLAEFLDLSSRRISQLAKEEIIPQHKRGKFPFKEAVKAYHNYTLSGGKSGNMRGTGAKLPPDASLNTEKAGLTRAQRLQAELKLRIAKGELHKSSDVKALVGGMLATTKSRLLDVPAKIAPRIVGKKELDDVEKIIEAEIIIALRSLVDYDPEVYRQRCREYKGGGDDDRIATYSGEDD